MYTWFADMCLILLNVHVYTCNTCTQGLQIQCMCLILLNVHVYTCNTCIQGLQICV